MDNILYSFTQQICLWTNTPVDSILNNFNYRINSLEERKCFKNKMIHLLYGILMVISFIGSVAAWINACFVHKLSLIEGFEDQWLMYISMGLFVWFVLQFCGISNS